MARLAFFASLALALVASSVGSEISNELEQHYEGYPHTKNNGAATGNPAALSGVGTQAAADGAQAVANKQQVNSFIPLIFSFTATKPTAGARPKYGTPFATAKLITVEQNYGPGDIPTYLFNGQKPTVPPNNYPSIFAAKNTTLPGRKMLAEEITAADSFAATNVITNKTFGSCLTLPAPITVSAGFDNYLIALCSGLTNLTNPITGGRRLQQAVRGIPPLKAYGEVKKSSDTGFPVLTFVFDFTSRPVLDLLTQTQPKGAVPPNGLIFDSCTIYLADGAYVTSEKGTCFNNSPVNDKGVVQPVVVKLAAKSFYYGSAVLGPNTGTYAGVQVAPLASFAVNFNNPVSGAPDSSIIYLATGSAATTATVQTYGVYADISGIYPGGTK